MYTWNRILSEHKQTNVKMKSEITIFKPVIPIVDKFVFSGMAVSIISVIFSSSTSKSLELEAMYVCSWKTLHSFNALL